jgi:hypothetical protein
MVTSFSMMGVGLSRSNIPHGGMQTPCRARVRASTSGFGPPYLEEGTGVAALPLGAPVDIEVVLYLG